MTDHELLPTAPFDHDDGEEFAHYGRFVSLGVIGRGGMGIVVRARDPELDRQVAIKVLGPAWTGTAAARLQREAQAMAKLSHPNVVTVYEMGTVGAQPFIAMELVEGVTLRRWLADEPRPWRAIVTAFIACGRGLEAAHAAGLVHRDFKPENVLIGRDGRPRVTDFGLVADGRTDLEGPGVLGTPAYMPPEQWHGEEIDARADQFSFCIALWEALFGVRPDVREPLVDPPRDTARRRVRQPDRPARHLIPILTRGLAQDRDARWPDMTALLAALEPKRPRWHYVALGGGVLAVVGIFAIVVAMRPDRVVTVDPCPDPIARLTGVWDSAAKHDLQVALAKTVPELASDTERVVVTALDKYAAAWRAGTSAACIATRVAGTQSAELLDRRMACLDRRFDELRALTSSLHALDRERMASLAGEVGSLGSIDTCADRDALEVAIAPPTDPDLRAKIVAVDAEIAASSRSRFGGKPADRQLAATAALAHARDTKFLPAIVRALEELDDAAKHNSDITVEESSLRELAQRAAEAHDDRLSAYAWISLMHLLANRHRDAEAAMLDPVADAAVTRAGAPTKLRFQLASARGTRLMRAQKFAESLAAYQTAMELADDDLARADIREALAQVTFLLKGAAGALPLAEDAAKSYAAAYGPMHPRTGDALHLVAEYLNSTGKSDRALETATKVLAIREVASGPDHYTTGLEHHLIALIQMRRKDGVAAAREHFEKAIAIFDANGRVGDAGLSRGMLATLISDLDGFEKTQPLWRRALVEAGKDGDDQTVYLAIAMNYAQRLIDLGVPGCAEARPLLDHATAVLAKVSPRQLPFALLADARCDVIAQAPAKAIAKLERAVASCTTNCPLGVHQEVRWQLGKLLVETGSDRARGTKLVAEVVAAATADHDDELLEEIATWKKAHR